jgi:hypothetical protein
MTAPEDTNSSVPNNEKPENAPETDESRLVTVERVGSGESLIFIARTRNAAEVAELDEFFSELKAGCRVRILSHGPLTAAAVKLNGESGESTAELMGLLEALGERYSFSKVEAGLHPTLNRLIEDMALDTGSDLHPVPNCTLCGRPEPFPTRLTLESPNRETMEALYCSRCTARHAEQEEKEWVGALLHSDRKTLAGEGEVELSPLPPRKDNRARYRLKLLPSWIAAG